MQMRAGLMRILRIVFIAVTAWLGFTLLQPKGLGWLVLVAAGAIAAIWIGYRLFVIRKHRREDERSDRWADALMDPPARPAVISEIRAQLAKSDPASVEFAQLTLVLAELLEADGEPEAAREALDRVKTDALGERMVTLHAHARAVAALSAGDADGAAAILEALPGPCGDRGVDLRVKLLRGVVAAERGDAERALEIAEQARKDARDDADLKLEARVLKAAALDAAGDRDDAVKVMRALGEDMLGVLVVLGLPRVKKLAEAALVED